MLLWAAIEGQYRPASADELPQEVRHEISRRIRRGLAMSPEVATVLETARPTLRVRTGSHSSPYGNVSLLYAKVALGEPQSALGD